MNRYTFKAKRKDNREWIYGYYMYSQHDCKEYIFTGNNGYGLNDCREFEYFEIIPETLCQYTGLQDIDGKDIFENDWFQLKEENQKCLVEWHDTGFMAREYWKHNDIFNSTNSWLGLLGYCKGYIKIIGNKFDKEED